MGANELNKDRAPIWDAHVHLFPPEIYNNWDRYAQRDATFAALTAKSPNGKGTEEAWVDIEESLALADEAGVTGLVMQGWYWNDPGLMQMHNDYMAEALRKYPERLRGFMSINPMFGEAALAEIERCAKMGCFSGIGELGPGGNGFDFETPEFLAVLDEAERLQLAVNIHCGEPVGHKYPGKDMTSLAPLPELVRSRPGLKLILAHLGGGLPFYEMNPRYRKHFGNVRYDFATNPLLYNMRVLRAVIDLIGVDRLLYGSDFPLLLYPRKSRDANLSLFIEDLRSNAGFTQEEWDKIMGQNVMAFID